MGTLKYPVCHGIIAFEPSGFRGYAWRQLDRGGYADKEILNYQNMQQEVDVNEVR